MSPGTRTFLRSRGKRPYSGARGWAPSDAHAGGTDVAGNSLPFLGLGPTGRFGPDGPSPRPINPTRRSWGRRSWGQLFFHSFPRSALGTSFPEALLRVIIPRGTGVRYPGTRSGRVRSENGGWGVSVVPSLLRGGRGTVAFLGVSGTLGAPDGVKGHPMLQERVSVPTEKIEAFCRKWRIVEFALFGSVLRDDFRPDSDVDVLVTFDPSAPWSLWDHARRPVGSTPATGAGRGMMRLSLGSVAGADS
jgi:hypothetical protein